MILATLVVLVGLGGAAAILWPDRQGVAAVAGLRDGLPAVDVDAGEAIYAAHCAACHGATLEGAPDWRTPEADGRYPAPPHDETGHTWHHDDETLFDYTRMGGDGAMATRGVTGVNSGMPGFEGILTDAEILDVLAYIKSTWPKRVRAAQAARSGG